MKKIVLDMQSRLYAKAIRRLLVQELDNYQVVISKSPSETTKQYRNDGLYLAFPLFL